MKKKIWITVLEKDEPKAKKIFQTVNQYGLATDGNFWIDDLEKMEWAGPAPQLVAPETALWIVSGTLESFNKTSIRYGLGLLAAMVQAAKGHGFPILLVPADGDLDVAGLPTALKGAETVKLALLGPKVAAKANIPLKKIAADYRLDLYPIPGLGLWFEIGPAPGHSWQGVMLGAQGGEVDAHGVGAHGRIPDRCVLEYAMKGLKLQAGDREFIAWAVKNTLSENDSYYARVRGNPKALLFGEMSEADDAEVFILSLE